MITQFLYFHTLYFTCNLYANNNNNKVSTLYPNIPYHITKILVMKESGCRVYGNILY